MSTTIQRNFAGGEISPALYARADLTRVATGLKLCRNWQVMKQGGVQTRPGTGFVCEVKDSTKEVALIPFIFNSSQAYMLEFGDEYIRIIDGDAQVTEAAVTITAIGTSNPIVVTAAGHGYATGDEVVIDSVVGMTQLNQRNFKVVALSLSQFSLTYMDGTVVDSTVSPFTAYVSGGTAARVLTIDSPYTAAEVKDLRYAQSADTLFLAHIDHEPYKFVRASATSWTMTAFSYGPSSTTPTAFGAAGGSGAVLNYKVSGIDPNTQEESLPTAADAAQIPSTGSPVTVTWTSATAGQEIDIYRETATGSGVYGFLTTVIGNSFVDNGSLPLDAFDRPIVDRTPFATASNYPRSVCFFQDRLTFASTETDPHKVFTSRTGRYNNFSVTQPVQDDDAVTFGLASEQLESIQHIQNLRGLLEFTSGAEWSTNSANDADPLTPTSISNKRHSSNGSGTLRPLLVCGVSLYVQKNQKCIFNMVPNSVDDSYSGTDLTIYANHLFDDDTLVDWCYQKTPHSIVWAVRDDGVLLGLTYLREQEILGWHQHETDGLFERVCSIPGETEDDVYFVVNRDDKRFIEKMKTRRFTDIKEVICMDSSLSYDGTNTGADTMTLSGGTLWDHSETLTLDCSASFFVAGDVNNQIRLTGSDDESTRFKILTYVSATQVTGKVEVSTPASLQTVATADWAKMVDVVSGLWHLEGKDVAVFGDGMCVASPNNSNVTTVTVADGDATLSECYSVIHVGLPYICDLESMDLENLRAGTTADKKKSVGRVWMQVERTRGLWVGPEEPEDSADTLDNLNEPALRDAEDYEEPVNLATGKIDLTISGEWSQGGRVFIRQVDPVPATVLSLVPTGFF